MNDRLEEIKARRSRATPGEWVTEKSPVNDSVAIVRWDDSIIRTSGFFVIGVVPEKTGNPLGQQDLDNIDFIINAHADIQWLEGEIERLVEELREVHGQRDEGS